MLKLDPTEWLQRLEPKTLKQLYELHEISELRQCIGRGKDMTALPSSDAAPNPIQSIAQAGSDERGALRETIGKRLELVFERIHERPAELVSAYSLSEGSRGFVVIWDHWQPCLKEIVCGRRPLDPTLRPSFEKQYLWDDSSGDEM